MTFSCWIAAFFPYRAIWQIPLRAADFLARVSNQVSGFPERIKRLGRDDWIVRFRPTKATIRKFPGLPQELTCRLVRYQFKGFRPSWLLTSLMDAEQFSRKELVNLYHRRWTIETIFREWKHALNIQNLRSATRVGIIKEIHAHLLLSNLVRWVMTEATEGTTDTPVDLSFVTCLTEVINAVQQIIGRGIRPVARIYEDLVARVSRHRIRKRTGRSYPRDGDGKVKYKGRGKYQQPARLTPENP